MKDLKGSVPALLLSGLLLAAACGGGAKVDLDPESQAFYDTGRLIMTKEETKIFQRLPDPESRKEFIADFWAKRDPNPDTEINEYRDEYQKRVDYANRRFREGGPGYNTDRGRVYIFMGPPDKFEEFFTHNDPSVRGAILWWIYYDYELGIEFVDETDTGKFKIRNYDGNFFEAMDSLQVGQWIMNRDVFRKKFVKFDLEYDEAGKAFEISIPAAALAFNENDEGKFQIDLEFVFYIYPEEGPAKETYREPQSFVASNEELLDMKTVTFRFSRELRPGTNYVDVIIQGRAGRESRVRRIFEVKVRS